MRMYEIHPEFIKALDFVGLSWLTIKCCMEIPYGASGLEHYGGEHRDCTPITIQGRPMHFAL